MGCGDEKLSKCLTQTFTAHCNAMICQQVTLSGDAEWPKVADAVIEADLRMTHAHHQPPDPRKPDYHRGFSRRSDLRSAAGRWQGVSRMYPRLRHVPRLSAETQGDL